VTQRCRRLAQRNGLRSLRFHALRHYPATELLTSGVDLRTVSGRLGHGTGATTLRFYAAWVNKADSKAADAIANVMPRPTPAQRAARNPYEELATTLRQAIAAGDYPVGQPLLTTSELAAQHSVSAGTVTALLRSWRPKVSSKPGRGRPMTVVRAD
jgi:hypothetical protein